MKIIYIITGLGMGGAECQLCDVADALSARGHQIHIICLSGDVTKKTRSKEVKITNLKIRKKNIFSWFLAYAKAWLIIHKSNPDIVHSHLFHANIFSRLLRLFMPNTKLISSLHSSYERGFGRMLIYRMTDCLTSISTNVSAAAVNSYITMKATQNGKMIVAYNGIDTNKYCYNEDFRSLKRNELGINCEHKLLLAVGRFTEAKDYPNLLKAFSLINDTKTYLAIIGSGEQEANLKALAKDYNVNQRIFWLGIRNDVEQWMSACDVFVLSSAWEGFGLVIAEALSCGCRVVATDCGGVKEVLGVHGKLVDVKESFQLASAIKDSLNISSNDANHLAKNSREWVEKKFSLDTVVDSWINLYRSLSRIGK
ncbi:MULTISPECIES: glycosyltransferase [Pectobacterium]|nr:MULTISPECIES: glycosyltransferase [Pectobacterium]MBN3132401.1 glycosyltransferase [Pectobacterium brasiliense]